MKEVAMEYLDALKGHDVRKIIQAREHFKKTLQADYFHDRVIWVTNHNDEVDALREKPVRWMTLHEVLVCLTNIVARDRIFGSMSGCEETGMMQKLLCQYIHLIENKP